MNANFIVNDYVIIWNLLFKASISESIYKLKQKIWDTYKKEYNSMAKDRDIIMKDYKNFIPRDDTIYNIVFETKDYDRLKREVEKYRIETMSIWDKNKRETEYLMKNIARIKLPKYTIFVVNKELNIVEKTSEDSLVIGRELNDNNPYKLLLDINEEILKKSIKDYSEEEKKFKDAILELAIQNEYQTRLRKSSCYQKGDASLKGLKRWLYPYWLMYLGVSKEDFLTYMMRDGIAFDVDKYAYEKELKKMNLEEFIDFCIRNQRYIIREGKGTIERLDVV